MAQLLVRHLDDNVKAELQRRARRHGHSTEEDELRGELRSETLEALSARFDGLLERMQFQAARKGMEAAYNATPKALGQAAARAAKRRRY